MKGRLSSALMAVWRAIFVSLVFMLHVPAYAGTVTYIYTDPQGTPLAEADSSGHITKTLDYRPYGSLALGQDSAGPGYTGHVNDPDTGLVYMQARFYDPVVGRFISVDQVGPQAGGIFLFNRQAYANNNPILNVDLDGRETGVAFRALNQGVQYPNVPARTTAEKFIAGSTIAVVVVPLAWAAPATAAALAEARAAIAAARAIAAANAAAATAQAAGATSGATAGLVTESGEVFVGASTNAGGPGMATNATVQEALDGVASSGEVSPFHGCCAEINAMSNAVNAGARLQNSVVATVRAAGSSAGRLMRACASCQAVAERLGVRTVTPPPPPALPPAPVPPPVAPVR